MSKKTIAVIAIVAAVAVAGGVFAVMGGGKAPENPPDSTSPSPVYTENTEPENPEGGTVVTTTNIDDSADSGFDEPRNASDVNANEEAEPWGEVDDDTGGHIQGDVDAGRPEYDAMLGQDFDQESCSETAKQAVEAFCTYNAGTLKNGSFQQSITPLIDSARMKSHESESNIAYVRSRPEWIRNMSTYPDAISYIDEFESIAVTAQKGSGEYFPVVMVTAIEIRNVADPGLDYNYWKVVNRYRSRYVVELSPDMKTVFSIVRSGSETIESDVTGIYSDTPVDSERHITPSFEGGI